MALKLDITYIGGPTALLDFDGVCFLTDPTFDDPGGEYRTGPVVLHKTAGPAVSASRTGRIDAVLLSHDHHFDNLDHSGRATLSQAGLILTTPAGAERLGGTAVGLANWQSVPVPDSHGRLLRVTGTPARHGPPDGDRGPVTGFLLAYDNAPDEAIYVSGDTVWFEGVAEVAARFHVKAAVLFLGAARVAVVGPAHLTMTAEEGVKVARAMPDAAIVPVHFEGWQHFSESRPVIEETFRKAGLEHRLRWPEAGVRTNIF